MITTLNQLTSIVRDNSTWSKVRKPLSQIEKTSARAISALDKGKLPEINPSLIYGQLVQGNFDCMYNDILYRHSRNPQKPITYVDGYTAFKVIIMPYGDNEYSITIAEMIWHDPTKILSSYTSIVWKIVEKKWNKKKNIKKIQWIDQSEFYEIFCQMIELMAKDMPEETRGDRVRSLLAWTYDY